MRIDHDTVLNMWAAGERTDVIAAAAGTFNVATVATIVSHARTLGDPRAVNRPKAEAFKQNAMSNIARYQRSLRLAKLPGDPAQLAEAVRSYIGPITVCPTAFHLGHRPKCLDAIGL